MVGWLTLLHSSLQSLLLTVVELLTALCHKLEAASWPRHMFFAKSINEVEDAQRVHACRLRPTGMLNRTSHWRVACKHMGGDSIREAAGIRWIVEMYKSSGTQDQVWALCRYKHTESERTRSRETTLRYRTPRTSTTLDPHRHHPRNRVIIRSLLTKAFLRFEA